MAILARRRLEEKVESESAAYFIGRDTLIGTLLVIATMTSATLLVISPAYAFPKFTGCVMVSLLACRAVDFFAKSWQFYMIDFCYAGVVQMLYFVFVCPRSAFAAGITYLFGTGFIGWSTLWWQSRLALHRLDVYTTAWLHYWPAVLAYALRWCNNGPKPHYYVYSAEFSWQHMSGYFAMGISWYFAWLSAYYVVIYKLYKDFIDRGNYITLIKQSYQNNPTIAKIMDIFGPEHRFAGYVVYHFSAFLAACIFAYICYFCQLLNLLFVLIMFLQIVWNGSKNIAYSIHKKGKSQAFKY